MTTLDPEALRRLCYTDENTLKTKPDCRASMINSLILDPQTDIDIDEAENQVDRLLREWNLWNEPSLEDLLREDEDEPKP